MKCCQPHWEELKQAIKDKGLYQLVHSTGEALMESMVNQLNGDHDKKDFDPLMNAVFAIYAHYLKFAGIQAANQDECPLCAVDRKFPGASKNWIEGSTDDQLAAARYLKLVPQVS